MSFCEDFLLYVDNEVASATLAPVETAVQRRNLAKVIRSRIARSKTIIRITVTRSY